MPQDESTTALLERPVAADGQPRVLEQLRAALEQELEADVRDRRLDADGALIFTDT
jgi:hypothetical protein